jgi:hypothetical protein
MPSRIAQRISWDVLQAIAAFEGRLDCFNNDAEYQDLVKKLDNLRQAATSTLVDIPKATGQWDILIGNLQALADKAFGSVTAARE